MVTHDFGEAALLADRVAVLDRGAVVQTGTATELAAAPASAFVADLTGAVVLTGTAHAERRADHGRAGRRRPGGQHRRRHRAGGGDRAPVGDQRGGGGGGRRGSARNRLPATVTSVTAVGNRVRVGLMGSQPMVAELTGEAAAGLGLAAGVGRWRPSRPPPHGSVPR